MATGNRIGLPVLVLLAAGLGVLSMPRPALAQSLIGVGACMWKCSCVDEGCTCSSKSKKGEKKGKGAGATRAKAGRKRTSDGLPVHSFQSLLADLATLTRNRVRPAVTGAMTADILARPTPLQTKAFRLLGVRP